MAIKLGQATVRERNFSKRESVNSSAEDFGAGDARLVGQLGKITQKFGHDAAEMYQESEAKKSRASVRDTLTAAQGELRQNLVSVYSQKGKDASNSIEEFDFISDAVKKKYGKDMSPDEMDLFSSNFQNYSNRHGERVFNHKLKQDEVFEMESKQGKVEGDIQDAVEFRNSDLDVQANLRNIKLDTASQYKHLGSDVVSSKTKEVVNKLFTEMVEAEKDNPESALSMAEKYKDQFLDYGKVKSDLEKHQIQKGLQEEALIEINEKKWIEKEFDTLMENPEAYNVPIGVSKAGKDQDEFKQRRSSSVMKIISLRNSLLKDANGKGESKGTNGVGKWLEFMALSDNDKKDVDLMQPEWKDAFNRAELKKAGKIKQEGSGIPKRAEDIIKYAMGSNREFNLAGYGKNESKTFTAEKAKQFHGMFNEQFIAGIADIPRDQLSEEKITKLVYSLLEPQVIYDEFFDGKSQQTRYKFELPYIQNKEDQEVFNKKIIREKIKNRDGVTTDGSGNFFIEEGDERSVYKKDGTLIKRQRKKSLRVSDAK
tara:strand:+ start:26694 stop:28313 length:1620 start_codon:yes stop_codon:yes gene_type:complete